MNKLLLRLGVAGAVAAGTIWVVRKYRANQEQAEELLQQRVAQAADALQQAGSKAQALFDTAVTKMATSWLGEPQGDDEPEDEKPADQYTNKAPLLDDGGKE